MNNRISAILAMGLLSLVLGGCASQQAVQPKQPKQPKQAIHTIILVPDPDGHIGKAEVTTANGRQLLEKPADMTRVSTLSAPPSPVATAEQSYIAATFTEALAVEPLPPEKFILYFETGKTVLVQESRAIIANIVAACKKRGAISVAISGHADASGSVAFNEKLSLQRSELVRDLLRRNGINPELMSLSSHGKRNPLVPTRDGVAEPRNRRVEIIVR